MARVRAPWRIADGFCELPTAVSPPLSILTENIRNNSVECARGGGSALQFPHGHNTLYAFRRLVRLDVRAHFGYSATTNFLEENMILEDLQYRYEGLKQRISLVRSYL